MTVDPANPHTTITSRAWESNLDYRLHLSEPGRPGDKLIDLLIRTTQSVPEGESISVAFYYLRNHRFCNALADARDRGVRVRILVCGHTHLKNANLDALRLLRERGFGSDLQIRENGRLRKGRMHLKLFLASATKLHKNVILTGTYNPSGNDIPEPEVFRHIGDQDRGYNYLIEINGSPRLYAHLEAHFNKLHPEPWRPRIFCPTTRTSHFEDLSLRELPTRTNPFLQYLGERLESGRPGRLRIAASHISHRATIAMLGRLRGAGHQVAVISHDSERRFSADSEKRLRASGVDVRRYVHPDRYPMHCKFVLSDYPDGSGRDDAQLEHDLFLGSMNLNYRSYYLNDDLFLRTSHRGLYKEFSALWERISAAISA